MITALHNISNWKRIINRQGNNTHVDKPKVKSVKKKMGREGTAWTKPKAYFDLRPLYIS